MRKISSVVPAATLSMVFFLLVSLPCPADRLANNDKVGLYSFADIDRILKMEDSEIDLATAALILSREWGTDKTLLRYRNTVDEWAQQILEITQKRHVPMNHEALEVINDYLFSQVGFDSVKNATDPEDLFLHTVIDKKRGYCLSLSMLYLAIGERLGLPLYGVVVPGHFFVRYDDGVRKINIETTSSGAFAPDKHYLDKFKPPENGIYMKNLTNLQSLGCFFNNLGNCYSTIGDFETARLHLERAVRINPNLAESRTNLGNIYLKLGYPEAAVSEYSAALKLLSGDQKIHNNIANAYTQAGDYNLAISHYKTAIRIKPDFEDAYKNMAIAYVKKGSLKNAVDALTNALKIDKTDTETYCNLGDIYMQMGSSDKAISSYRNCLWIDPMQAYPNTKLGYCYLKKGYAQQAADFFRTAVSLDPALTSAYFGLALACGQMGQPHQEIEAYEQLLAIDPHAVAAMQNLANAYAGIKQYDAAVELYTRAISLDPANIELHFNLALLYSNMSDHDKAIMHFNDVIELDPTNGDAHNGLAYSYYMMDMPGLSYQHAIKAKEMGCNVPEVLLESGKIISADQTNQQK